MERYSQFSRSRFTNRQPLFGTLNTPSAAMDKPYPDNRHIAMASMEVPQPAVLPPFSETARELPSPIQDLDSNNVPKGMQYIYRLGSQNPPIPYSQALMDRSSDFTKRSDDWASVAKKYARGGEYDRPILRMILPVVGRSLESKRQQALARSDEFRRDALTALNNAYTIGNNAQANAISAANVAASGVRNFAATPSANIGNMRGIEETNRLRQIAAGLEYQNTPQARQFDQDLKILGAQTNAAKDIEEANRNRQIALGLKYENTPQARQLAQDLQILGAQTNAQLALAQSRNAGRLGSSDFANEAAGRREMFLAGKGPSVIIADIAAQQQAYSAGGQVPSQFQLRNMAAATTRQALDDAWSSGLSAADITGQKMFDPQLSMAFKDGIDSPAARRQAVEIVAGSFPDAMIAEASEAASSPRVAAMAIRRLAEQIVDDYQQRVAAMTAEE